MVRDRGFLRAVAALGAAALMLAACGTQAAGKGMGSEHRAGAAAQVLYAGSLVDVMENVIGPRFSAASGYGYQGVAGGSSDLAYQIQAGIRRGDVFISASPKVNATLDPAWERWYVRFGKSPLVLGYNPHSSFASALRHRPWYEVIPSPRLRLGRTDPQLDPKGALTVQALHRAEHALHRPGFAHRVLSSARDQVFPETELVGRLQAGQLDAAFLYTTEAEAAHIPTVPLDPVHLGATYTVTLLRHAPDRAAGVAFIAYLLGRQGRSELAGHGVRPIHPRVHGDGGALPARLRDLLAAR